MYIELLTFYNQILHNQQIHDVERDGEVGGGSGPQIKQTNKTIIDFPR